MLFRALCFMLFFFFGISMSVFAKVEQIKFGIVKSSSVNVRKGPSTEYGIVMQFTEYGVPVRILNSVDGWTKIKDIEGQEGWVKSYFVSEKMRKCVIHKNQVDLCRLPVQKGLKCEVIAILQNRLTVDVLHCREDWCRIRSPQKNVTGWVRKWDVWGVGMKEVF